MPMSKRTIWSAAFLTLTAAAVGMEIWGAWDSSSDTTTWTELIVRFIPAPVVTVAVAALIRWLPGHFRKAEAAANKGDTMKAFRFQPVAWLTTASAILGAAATISATPPFAGHVPDSVSAWLAGATVIVTVVLGVLAHNRVTPLAAPRDNAGNPLVPAEPVNPNIAAKPHGPMRPMRG